MSAQTVLDRICRYFGGTYDPDSRTYRTPQIAGLGVVRRASAKDDVHDDYFLSAPDGENGCQMVVQLSHGERQRRAQGVKRVRYTVELHVFVLSVAAYAEDTQDYGYGLLDAISAHFEADRTCGSGGFEAGGFQVGEGDQDVPLRWDYSQGRTDAQVTKGYLYVETAAVEYIQA